MPSVFQPARWPAAPALAGAWAVYALALVVGLPFSPLAVLTMVLPLGLVGWYAKGWGTPALVGLVHGAALAGLGIWAGAFSAWGPGVEGFALVAAVLMLLSWFTAMAGRTVRLVQVLRERTDELEALHLEVEGSEASVDAIVSATNVALVGVGPDGRIDAWNPGAESVFGRSAGAMKGQPLDALAASGEGDCVGPLRYVLDTGRSIPPFTGRMPHGDGHMLDVEVRTKPVRRADGNGLILSVTDRTREHTVEEALEEATLQFDSLVRNLDEVIYSVEVPSHKTLLLSKTSETVTGRPVSDFSNFHRFLELAHPDDAKTVTTRWNRARSGERSALRWRIRDAEGHHHWVSDSVVPSRDEEGRVVRVDGIIRQLGRDLELERQAQRMMRWLDGMEPLTGCGAWSLDLRGGDWQWSSGVHAILGTSAEEEETLETWMARLGSADAARLEALVDDPEGHARPFTIHVYNGDEAQECLVEPWVQRGADGEPIWLYGLLRPKQHTAGREAESPRSGLASAVEAPMGGRGDDRGGMVTVQATRAAGVRPGSPEAVDRFLRAALSRSRQAVAAAGEQREEADPEVRSAIEDAVQETVTDAIAWAKHRRTPVATGPDAVYEPIQPEVSRLAGEATQDAVHRILAAEQEHAETKAQKARLAAMQAEERIRAETEKVRRDAETRLEEATRRAEREAARAAEAEAARQKTQSSMTQALAEAERARDEAIAKARRARQQALREAELARQRADREAASAKQATQALAEAETAREQAAKEAERAKQQALSEAGEARAAALEVAQSAKMRAQRLANEAREAAKARDAAEAARQEALAAAKRTQEEAIREAQAAKEQAIRDAEEATAKAMAQAKEAERRAEDEAGRAREAEAARMAAQKAAEEAVATMRLEAEQAMQEAQRLRDEARKEAEQARAAARAEAVKAQQAEQARERAVKEAERERDRAIQEAREERAKAVAAAEAARDHALREAMAARAETERQAAALAEAEALAAKEAEAAVERAAHERVAEEQAAQGRVAREAEAAEEAPAEAAPSAQPAKDERAAPSRPPRPAPSPWLTAEQAARDETGVEMDVVWDDEIGWIPKPRGGRAKDKAEQIKAKEVSKGDGRRKAGPWALDE